MCAQTDPDIFFPEKGGSTRDAKSVCRGCEVREMCLQYALANDEKFGIWGGLSERERRRLRRGLGPTFSAMEERHARIHELAAEGMVVVAIMERLGVSEWQVRHELGRV